ncbi:hypothetical protein [Streptomyces lasiicapitis]|uniref:hypothetical protein n=1 Tax=Streptomyces lasiicapitis TaxID=1923961 RepID=UPI0036992305
MAPDLTLDYDRLAQAARRRRAQLGLALNDENAKAAGTSKGTWRRVEKGLGIRETNYVKIDGLLHWAPGSSIKILDGGDPVPIADTEEAPGFQISPVPLDRETRATQALEAVQLALIGTAKGSTAEEIRQMSKQVVREMIQRGLI